jgi:hypothetical protein
MKPRNRAKRLRNRNGDPTQMCEKVVAVAMQPPSKSSGAVQWIVTASVSRAQRQLREYRSFESSVDAHASHPSGHCRQCAGRRWMLDGSRGQLDKAGQCRGRSFVTHQELERERPMGIKRSGKHTDR